MLSHVRELRSRQTLVRRAEHARPRMYAQGSSGGGNSGVIGGCPLCCGASACVRAAPGVLGECPLRAGRAGHPIGYVALAPVAWRRSARGAGNFTRAAPMVGIGRVVLGHAVRGGADGCANLDLGSRAAGRWRALRGDGLAAASETSSRAGRARDLPHTSWPPARKARQPPRRQRGREAVASEKGWAAGQEAARPWQHRFRTIAAKVAPVRPLASLLGGCAASSTTHMQARHALHLPIARAHADSHAWPWPPPPTLPSPASHRKP